MARTKNSVRHLLPVALIAAVVIPLSFGAGMRLSGDVQTVSPTKASDVVDGDMDGDGTVTNADVRIVLDIAQGGRAPTPAQLRADPNHDGKLTVDDAMRLLRQLPPS